MFWTKGPELESTRYYYSDDNKIFEKSLDVVRPVHSKKNEKTTNNQRPLPIVILVVGSAWLGHRAFVYTGTSWWNASGPRTIASLGTTCVCIRHRGAFCVLPPVTTLAQFLVLVLAVVGAVTGGQWDVAIAVTGGLAFFLALLALGGRGSAQLEDMLEDVSEALKWVQSNRELLEPPKATAIANKETDTTTPASAAPLSDTSTSPSTDFSSGSEAENNNEWSAITPLVFGGYSSGGHVATTLLHQPERFHKHGLPPPDKLFQAILIISGMMAVRQEKITLQDCKTKESLVVSTPPGKPQWCTTLVLETIWGPEKAKNIISPLAQTKPPPALPHLLIGNRNEVFGLPWLDIYFASSAYCDRVQALTGAPAKYVEVESDHWFILSSTALRNALQEELPNLIVSK